MFECSEEYTCFLFRVLTSNPISTSSYSKVSQSVLYKKLVTNLFVSLADFKYFLWGCTSYVPGHRHKWTFPCVHLYMCFCCLFVFFFARGGYSVKKKHTDTDADSENLSHTAAIPIHNKFATAQRQSTQTRAAKQCEFDTAFVCFFLFKPISLSSKFGGVQKQPPIFVPPLISGLILICGSFRSNYKLYSLQVKIKGAYKHRCL